jgi:hypothetical protein
MKNATLIRIANLVRKTRVCEDAFVVRPGVIRPCGGWLSDTDICTECGSDWSVEADQK